MNIEHTHLLIHYHIKSSQILCLGTNASEIQTDVYIYISLILIEVGAVT